jgi:hypothetical protein
MNNWIEDNGVIACLVAGALLGMLFGFALGW